MHLEGRGHPLHTRALAVTLAQRADALLDASGYVLDLRKRGFVPVAGDLQTSGIVHDMRLAGVVDPTTPTLVQLEADQRSVAFEPSGATSGESCRDPIDRIRALAGAPLDDGWARRVGTEIGGPRGCSHLLVLGHLLGASVAWALARDRELVGATAVRVPGERVFRRDLVVDGFEPAPGRLQLVAQLTDVHCAPAPAVAPPMARFAGETEVRALAELDLSTFTLERIILGERRRTRADFEQAAWRTRDDVAAGLAGLRLGPGVTGELLRRLGDRGDDRPVLDLLLALAPTIVQCVAALSEAWIGAARANPSLIGMGGLPDSCYMWRRGGALARAREAEGGWPPAR